MGACWMSHCRGSPSLVTLVRVCSGMRIPGQVCAYLDPIVGSAHAYLTKCQRPESIVHEHMADREDRVPSVTLDLDDMRLRYDAYHGSTRLPPGSTSTGEPIQHEQAVQGGTRLRKTEMRPKAMVEFSAARPRTRSTTLQQDHTHDSRNLGCRASGASAHQETGSRG